MPGVMVQQQQQQQLGDASSIKAELRKLMDQKDALEREINERSARLSGPGGAGLEGSLVDKQGFPRADIDVHAARTDRHRVICLTNDHKALSDTIAKLLADLHAASRENGSSNGMEGSSSSPSKKPRTEAGGAAAGPAASAPVPADMEVDAAAAPARPPARAAPPPFAVVDEVSDSSPASAAGIRIGDQLCRFGDVEGAAGSSSSELLPRVAAVLTGHEGRPVEAVFLRAGAPVVLSLVPQKWAGRGLLGCHLRPLR